MEGLETARTANALVAVRSRLGSLPCMQARVALALTVGLLQREGLIDGREMLVVRHSIQAAGVRARDWNRNVLQRRAQVHSHR